ncbi:hypothetical protein MINT15_25510 [Saccharomonospora viridis]|uniref:Uncharacterized protein n=1 Tax=Saccharomonospora viridis TaxID=1852 RepID=A0A837DDE1_9PSEU|nr:hypothetical protein MINT15_25510 [Saccharomonospora viridis]
MPAASNAVRLVPNAIGHAFLVEGGRKFSENTTMWIATIEASNTQVKT